MSIETDRIEQDISQKRHRLNDTIEALGNKLSPGQLVDEAMGLLQGQAGHLTANLGRQLRDNPLPAVLIAVGVAMYVMNKDKGGTSHAHANVDPSDWDHDRKFRSVEETRWRTARQASETEDAFHDRLHQAYATALDIRQNAGEAIDSFKRRVGETVHSLEASATTARHRISHALAGAANAVRDNVQHAGEKAADVKHSAQDLYADNPLAGGAIALAIGALLGSTTPLTDIERDKLSDVADKAAAAGQAFADKGTRALDRVSPVH